MFTDTHCHLAADQLRHRLPEITDRAAAAGVNAFIVPAAQQSDWPDIIPLCAYPFVRTAAIGIHPWFADTADHTVWQDLDAHLHRHSSLWVGETGLDFLRAQTDAERQQQLHALHIQLDLAQQHSRPVILHNVKSTAALSGSLKHTQFMQGGIVHAFSGSLEEAQLFIRQGFLIGLGSLLLNPHAKKVRQVAAKLPESAIVLETDSPYMLPGQTNTPANLAAIAAQVAKLRGICLSELAQLCEKNLCRLQPETLHNANP